MKLIVQNFQYFKTMRSPPNKGTHCFRLVIFVILGIGVWLSICIGKTYADTGNSLEKVSLQLKWYHQFQFAGYYAAKAQGFYREEGLDVTIVEGGPPNPSPLESVLSGQAQYGVLDGELLNARLRQEPVVLLAVIFQHSPNVLMSRKDSGITKPSDFIGRTIMYTKGHSEIELKSIFIYEGVPLDKIKFVPHTGSIDPIIDRLVDADTAYLTNEPYMMLKRGVEPALLKPVNYGIDFYGDSLFTTEDEIRLHPERVAAFRRASIKGWEFAMNNIDEMIDFIMTFPSVTEHNFTADQFRFEAEKMAELIQPKLVEIGHVNPLRWKRMADTFVHLKLFKPDYSLDGFFYDPNPKPNYKRLRLTIGIIASILLIVGIYTIFLLSFNRRLAQEINERKRVEEALKSAQDGLEGKVAERTAELQKEITERKKVSDQLHNIEWLLEKTIAPDSEREQYTPPYGNLVAINTNRVLLDSVGQETLNSIAGDILDLLDTSSAIYEKNGDYALGIFSSGWCRFLDNASRNLCATDDNRKALKSGLWLCHESCWSDASKVAIETGQPTDIECHGGIRLYALPIWSGQEIVGAINLGYGSLPTDKQKLQEIAEKYHVQVEELLKKIEVYEERPKYIQEIAKKRLHSAARLIGEIVERKQAEEKLRMYQEELELRVETRTIEVQKSKEEWEKTFDSMSDIITIQDKDMRIIRANKAAHDAFQVDPGALNGKYCYEVFREANRPCSNCPELSTLKKKTTHSATITHENLRKIFNVTSSPVLNDDGEFTHLVHIAKDITEHKKMEAELFQAHKMEAIGTLAGGIAHDFNNILAAILGYADMAKDDIPEWSHSKNYIDQVLKAGNRAKELVRQILTFSRKGAERYEPMQPFPIIKEGLKLMRASLPTTIEIQEEIDSKCGLILGDPTNIHQILVNLCTNALHAMEDEKGVLTVTLTRMELKKDDVISEADISEGEFVKLKVSDTGCGMDKETVERIFEPYFTTKGVGKGSGMGLALVHGIVQSCGGFVKAESAPGKGSTFHVYFPAIEEKNVAVEEEKKAPLPRGNERILAVDDEESIVGLNQATLDKLGYKVTAHCSSEKALEVFQASPNDFDLIITDQTMPHLSGSELAKKILHIRPDIPIIMCTGYSSMISEEKAKEIGIKKFVMKPAGRMNMAIAVREVLDKNKPKSI